jgi:hypothetical protein
VANNSINVDVTHHHVMAGGGSFGSNSYKDQLRDGQRFDALIAVIYGACEEYGFAMVRLAVVEDRMQRDGHWPELHVVVAQLPSEVSDMLKSGKREV